MHPMCARKLNILLIVRCVCMGRIYSLYSPQHICKTIDSLHFYTSTITLINTHKPIITKDITSN